MSIYMQAGFGRVAGLCCGAKCPNGTLGYEGGDILNACRFLVREGLGRANSAGAEMIFCFHGFAVGGQKSSPPGRPRIDIP